MKNALFYYYKINPLKIVKNKNHYSFEDNDYLYFLWVIDKPLDYIKEIVELNRLINSNGFVKIVFNIKNEAISLIDNKYYILCQCLKNDLNMEKLLVNPYYSNKNMANFRFLNHSNWSKLWCAKIDYFEYQKDYIKIKYPLLYKSLDYFIGLSENAISYFNSINSCLSKDISDQLVVSRRRISFFDNSFYNPLNYIVDNKARDVAEYFKYLFVIDEYNYEEIESVIDKLNYSSYQYSLLMDRLLFPSFYFDLYENIINGNLKESEISKVLDRSGEYELFLKNIYIILNKKKSILKIDWLESFN